MILAKYLEHSCSTLNIAGCRAIELGAGTGFCGIALAALGAEVSRDDCMPSRASADSALARHASDNSVSPLTITSSYNQHSRLRFMCDKPSDFSWTLYHDWREQEVILTDLPYALSNLAANIAANEGIWSHSSTSVTAQALDWKHADTACAQLGSRFDLIVAADVVWLDDLISPFVHTLECLTASDSAASDKLATVILLSYQERSRATTAILMRELGRAFSTERISDSSLHHNYRSDKIAVYRIQRRTVTK